MPKRMLPLTLVQKRRGILEAKDTSNRPVDYLISHALNEAAGTEPSTKSLREFFERCTKDKANTWYKYGLVMLEDFDGKDPKLSKTLVHLYTENAIPYVEDLNKLSEALEGFHFQGIDLIKETVNEYKVADRINRNHNAISKRFNIKKFITENQNMGLVSLTEEVCKLIDTYNIPSYAKLNNTLEECYYIFGSVYPQYNPVKSVSTIVDYYLLRENNLPKFDLESYKRIIENSRVIPKRARSSISFLFESKDLAESKDVKKLIDQFKKDEEKNSGKLEKMVNKIFSNKPENIIDDMPNLLGLLRTMISIGAIAIQPLVGIAMLIVNKCIAIFTEANQAEKMVKYFNKERDAVEKKIENTKNESKQKELREYKACLDKCIEKLETHHRDITGGLDAETEEESTNESTYYSLQEYKLFKHQNLIRAAMDSSKVVELNYHRMKKAGNASSNKFKSTLHHLTTPTAQEKYEMEYNKLGNKMKRGVRGVVDVGKDTLGFAGAAIFGISFMEAAEPTDDKQIISLVNDMDEMDVVFAAIEYDNPEEGNKIAKQFTPVVKNINKNIKKDNVHVAAIASDLGLEFHMISDDKIALTEEEKELREHTISPRDMFYISYIQALSEQLENYADLVLENGNIFDDISSRINPRVNFDKACILMELYALSPKCKTKDTLSQMIDYYCTESDQERFYKSTRLHQLCDGLVSSKLSLQESTDMYQIANDILKEGTSVTAAKMAMMKLKKDITKANSNVREGMRNMEIAMSGVTRSIEKALTTDKREEVIKGSVLPSFTKVMKLGIVSAAAWAIHPVAGIIIAVGALGASKALSHREKEMILDEIEVELRVVKREIERCNDTARPEKYRALVQYERRLERERHRIKMSMSTRGRRVPEISQAAKGDD